MIDDTQIEYFDELKKENDRLKNELEFQKTELEQENQRLKDRIDKLEFWSSITKIVEMQKMIERLKAWMAKAMRFVNILDGSTFKENILTQKESKDLDDFLTDPDGKAAHEEWKIMQAVVNAAKELVEYVKKWEGDARLTSPKPFFRLVEELGKLDE